MKILLSFEQIFFGVTIEDIPNTCEKTIFIKKELTDAISTIDSFFLIFDAIFNYAISKPEKFSKEEALRILTILCTHIYLNDTRRGFPHAYIQAPILKSPVSGEYLKKAYEGYVYALQYLWFVLLSKEEFENSSVKDLHKAHELYSGDADKKIESQAGIPVSEEELKKEYVEGRFEKIHLENLLENEGEILFTKELTPEDMKKLEAEKERLRKLKDWFALDMFFGKINDEIANPLEKQKGINFLFSPLLTINSNFDKSLIGRLLSEDVVEEPKYITDSSKKALKKMLDYLFLWYNVEVLDTQRISVFNGVPAFVSLLIGNVELSRIFGNGEKVFIRIFKHPVKGVNGYDYSYAILNQAFGSTGIADHSGWLVFFDCAGDYSGFAGSLKGQAELFIEKFIENEKIEVKEKVIDRDIFKKYLAEKSTSSVFDEIKYMTPDGVYTELSISEIKRKAGDFIGNAKGKFFEYLFYVWLTDEKQNIFKTIRCDFLENGEQIDIKAEAENEIHVFECKVNFHGGEITQTIEQMVRKVKAFKPHKKRIIPWLVIFSQIQSKHKEKFENAGIRVCESFNAKIKNWRKLSDEERKKIFWIFNFQF